MLSSDFNIHHLQVLGTRTASYIDLIFSRHCTHGVGSGVEELECLIVEREHNVLAFSWF